MKKAFFIIFLIASIPGLGLFSKIEPAHASGMDFSVRANIPDNQIDKNLSYFDLQMNPSSSQRISLTVENSSNKEIQVRIEPNAAITNQNGVIDYSKHNHENDSSLKHAFSDIISPSQTVSLKGKESKKVFFDIQMPKQTFDGIILGGFYVYRSDGKEEEVRNNKNIQIKNAYSYVVGAKLRETAKIVFPELKLNEVTAGLVNYHTVVTANLQNVKPVIVKNLDVEARITKEGTNKTLHQTEKKNLSMAPNSNFDFPIDWDNQKLEPGKYHLYVTATNGHATWNFDKVFEIKNTEAKKLNDKAVELEKDHNLMLIFIGLAVIILALILFIIVLLRKNKRGVTNEESFT
ncbi:DUF916 and DUF3324 domain-containing protein [Paenibacillus montanisoli]|uniref:DUF916 and DUF3324 domain-containing protein n=1 Tax=Paenibacillus montanisoli TaxID=2081970 RepID=A0A328TT28_9BACL|nr:DUF916 and DUF3324 domain-containing protein [Paenibacillus montanisoli]RAP73688.1 DUF916 and DUF3324 domain-containing protein [Paenibacillus montanisoli]